MRLNARLRNLFGVARLRVRGSLLFSTLALMALRLLLSAPAQAQETPPAEGEATLFQNVRIFDGKSSTLSMPSYVLVRGILVSDRPLRFGVPETNPAFAGVF